MTQTALSNQSSNKVEKTKQNGGRKVSPPVDIFENSESFLIVADVPGVEPDGLTVEYNPPELSVTARPANGSSEFVYDRRFELGSGVDPNAINAELRNGVLRIELKKSAHLRPRRIEVRSA